MPTRAAAADVTCGRHKGVACGLCWDDRGARRGLTTRRSPSDTIPLSERILIWSAA